MYIYPVITRSSKITGKRGPTMSSRMSINDEIREQQQKTKDMTVKGKLSYFWYYYKVQTIAAILVIVFIAGFIQSYVTRKEYGFYTALINAVTYDANSKTADTWAEEFRKFAGFDPDEYQVCLLYYTDAGYYTYLSDNNTTFQGHPSQVILGIPITDQEPRLALKFLEYLGVSS